MQGLIYLLYNHTDALGSEFTLYSVVRRIDRRYSDYKDNGTNILLDANENAFGPSLTLDRNGSLANGCVNGPTNAMDHVHPIAKEPKIDLLGLNRYPDPYVSSPFNVAAIED